MPDREKVIKALDCCLDIVRSGRWASGCVSCPYAETDKCREQMILDAIALLKEQPDEHEVCANCPVDKDYAEVVRCKDCKWWDRKSEESKYGYCHACKHGFHSKNWEIGIYRIYNGDFFCADGETEETEEEEEEEEE